MRQSVLVLTGSLLRLESTLVGNVKASLLLPTIGSGGQSQYKFTLQCPKHCCLVSKAVQREDINPKAETLQSNNLFVALIFLFTALNRSNEFGRLNHF